MHFSFCALAVSALVIGSAAHAAGKVDVEMVNPQRFADSGGWNRGDANLETISRYLRQLGTQYLPAGQSLKIEVLDVDLAGYVRPSRRGDVRLLIGGADWPRIQLRYTLQGDGQTLQSGEAWVSDLNYLRNGADLRSYDPLRHEKRMLELWFRQTFAPSSSASS